MERDESLSLERRKFPRFKDNIFIQGQIGLSPIREFGAFTSDISAGGLMFETEEDIPIESKLQVEIYQPMDCTRREIFSILVLAKVKWTRIIKKDNFEQGENKYRAGIEFSEIKEEDRKIIATYIQRKTSEK